MNCLWNLRPWLLPREAAAYLSAAIGEQVDEAEILRWALDDQIELSVRLDAPIAARRTESEASRHEPIEGLCALVIEGAVRTALENLFDVQRDLRSTWQPIYFPVALVKKDGPSADRSGDTSGGVTWVQQRLVAAGLLKGRTVAIDATTLEANAAMRSIVRRGYGGRLSGVSDPPRRGLRHQDPRRTCIGSCHLTRHRWVKAV